MKKGEHSKCLLPAMCVCVCVCVGGGGGGGGGELNGKTFSTNLT